GRGASARDRSCRGLRDARSHRRDHRPAGDGSEERRVGGGRPPGATEAPHGGVPAGTTVSAGEAPLADGGPAEGAEVVTDPGDAVGTVAAAPEGAPWLRLGVRVPGSATSVSVRTRNARAR